MPVFLLIFWIILNGKITLEIIIFGICISLALSLFIYSFLNYSVRTDLFLLRNLPRFIAYIFLLIYEIILANLAMAKFILSKDQSSHPAIVDFHSPLKTRSTQTLLANSITLTPGTISVDVKNDTFYVHCYDISFAEGLNESSFVRLLSKIEATL